MEAREIVENLRDDFARPNHPLPIAAKNTADALDKILSRLSKAEADLAVAKEALERMPNAVPTNWLDPLLSGPDVVVSEASDCRGIEALLRGVQDRLRDIALAALEKIAEERK